MALQGSLNSALGKIIGLWEATLLVHIIGTAVGPILLTPLDQGEAKSPSLGTPCWAGS